MNNNKTSIIFLLLVFAFIFANQSKAQYVFTPSKTLEKNQFLNSLSYDSIHIANNSTDTLFLHWEFIKQDTSAGSYFDFCASGECYLGFPATGSFPPIKPGGFGYAGVHLWTGNNPITVSASIYIYKEGSYTAGDTINYILHAVSGIGVNENIINSDIYKVYPNPAKEKICIKFNADKTEVIHISLFNTIGEVVYNNMNINTLSEIPLNGIPKGIYFLKICSENRDFIEKVVVCK